MPDNREEVDEVAEARAKARARAKEERKEERDRTGRRAKVLLVRLIAKTGMTPGEVSAALGDRVTPRTIYRWWRGESNQGNRSNFDELYRCAMRFGVDLTGLEEEAEKEVTSGESTGA